MAGYLLKIQLEKAYPPVWRRAEVPERISFGDLHRIIQILFGWENDHLHCFSFPDLEIEIMPEEGGSNDWYTDENNIQADTFLEKCKWIRYIYDFGDEWCHKIVLEKKDPAYQLRHAVLLKAEGKNFEEDSGGVLWCGDDQRIAFRAAAVGKRLNALKLPVMKEEEAVSREVQQLFEMAELQKKMDALWKKLKKKGIGSTALRQLLLAEPAEQEKLIGEFAQKGKKRLPSAIAGKIKSWREFCGRLEILEERTERQEWQEAWMEKKEPEKTWTELLTDLDSVELNDYCKYLRIPVEKRKKKEWLANEIFRAFLEHPEYLLYVFDCKQLENLAALMREKNGRITIDVNVDAVALAIGVGLTDLRSIRSGGGEKIVLSFAAEAEELLEKLLKSDYKKERKKIDKVSGQIECCLNAYGMLELEEFYRIYCENYGKRLSEEAFLRHLYWHCRFLNRIQTAVCAQDQKAYAVIPGVDLGKALKGMLRYAAEIPWRKYNGREMKQWEQGLQEAEPWWNALAEYLVEYKKMEIEAVEHVITAAWEKVVDGCSSTELIVSLTEGLQVTDVWEWKHLWETFMRCCMENHLAMLKGHSRKEFAERTGTDPFSLELLDSGKLQDEITADTHLYEMPAEIQKMAYSAMDSDNKEISLKKLESILAQGKEYNPELAFLLAEGYMNIGKIGKTNTLLKKVEPLLAKGDNSIGVAREILEYREGMESRQNLPAVFETGWNLPDDGIAGWNAAENVPVQMPYKRETPKIGRNDPCPCGSGKKYKKCCGKDL